MTASPNVKRPYIQVGYALGASLLFDVAAIAALLRYAFN